MGYSSSIGGDTVPLLNVTTTATIGGQLDCAALGLYNATYATYPQVFFSPGTDKVNIGKSSGTDILDINTSTGLITIGPKAADTKAFVMGGGTFADPITTSTTADKNILCFFTKSTATTGGSRTAYLHHQLTGAGGSGEAVFSATYAKTTGVLQCQGLHAIGGLGAGGSVTGQCVGVRAAVSTNTGLTLTTGQFVALRVESNYASDVPDSTFVEFQDLQTAKTDLFARFVGCTGDAVVTTFAGNATNQDRALKVDLNGTPYYIPLQNAVS